VENFHNQIESLDYFRLTFTPSLSDKSGREFQGVLDYNKLVRLRNRLIYQTTDVVRLISFRREAIETAILTQDLLNGQKRGDMRVQSYYLRGSFSFGDRDQTKCFNRFLSALQYLYLTYFKSLISLMLSIVTAGLSLIILYA
jgi:hypothetical protein